MKFKTLYNFRKFLAPALNVEDWENLSDKGREHLKQMQLALNKYNYHVTRLKEELDKLNK